jgi:hypothetical protein
MNQPGDEFARRIVAYLDYGADHLEPGTRDRLVEARKLALARYQEQPKTLKGLVWAGNAAVRYAEHRFHGARYLIAAAALVAAVLGIAYWQSMLPGPANELAEIDAKLLADELPINAYLDKGFDSWLKRSSR